MMHTRKYRNLSSAVALLIFMLAGLYSVSAYSRDSVMLLDNNQFADPEAAFEEFSLVDEAEMGTMRGGLLVGSLNIDFGVNLRTLINGVVQLETAYRLTDTGFTQQVTQADNLLTPASSTTPDTLSAPSGRRTLSLGNGIGQSVTDAATGNLALTGLSDASGVVITDAQGKTTVALHQVTRDRILGVLVSDASNQNVEFDLDVNVTISNYSQIRQQVLDARTTGILSRAIDQNNLR